MPHPWPCAFTRQNKSFWAGQEILDLRTEVSQCSRLCADSFLRDKLNPLWEGELQMPPNSTPKALQGLSSERAREMQMGWQAGREPENRKRAPVPEVVSKRDFFQPDKWMHTAASLMGLQCSLPLQHCSWTGQPHKLKTRQKKILLMLFFNPRMRRNAVNKNRRK